MGCGLEFGSAAAVTCYTCLMDAVQCSFVHVLNSGLMNVRITMLWHGCIEAGMLSLFITGFSLFAYYWLYRHHAVSSPRHSMHVSSESLLTFCELLLNMVGLRWRG